MRPQPREIDKTVDLPKQVIVRDMPLEAEAVEQRFLHYPPLAHHRPNLPQPGERNQRPARLSSRVFQHNRRIAGLQESPGKGGNPSPKRTSIFAVGGRFSRATAPSLVAG